MRQKIFVILNKFSGSFFADSSGITEILKQVQDDMLINSKALNILCKRYTNYNNSSCGLFEVVVYLNYKDIGYLKMKYKQKEVELCQVK